MEIGRRDFLKTFAAASVAVSVSAPVFADIREWPNFNLEETYRNGVLLDGKLSTDSVANALRLIRKNAAMLLPPGSRYEIMASNGMIDYGSKSGLAWQSTPEIRNGTSPLWMVASPEDAREHGRSYIVGLLTT